MMMVIVAIIDELNRKTLNSNDGVKDEDNNWDG